MVRPTRRVSGIDVERSRLSDSGVWRRASRAGRVRHISTPTAIVAQLAARGVEHIYVDGGITIQRFLQEGLIQRLIITRVPVLIGAGIPLFGAVPHDIALTPVWTRQYASGLVQTEYVVAA
jgi:riboflavin biosynthesis pyrimidine reductase